jgi:hypothetical protein
VDKRRLFVCFNGQFNLFAADNMGLKIYRLLQNALNHYYKGAVSILLSSKIRNIDTNAIIGFFAENQAKKCVSLEKTVEMEFKPM